MFRHKPLVLFFVIGLIFTLLTGCSSNTSTGNQVDQPKAAPVPGAPSIVLDKDTVNFAFISMVQGAPQPLINKDAKIFEEELKMVGKKVKFVSTRSLDKIWPLMDDKNNDLDFVYIPTANFSTYITATSRFGGSNKYTIIAGSNNADSTALFVGPKIKSLKDLAGKTIGIANLRYQDEFQLNKVLNTVGLATDSAGGNVKIAYDDIVVKTMDNFTAGKYDAIVMYDPENFPVVLKNVLGSKMLTTLNPAQMFGSKQPRTWLVAKKDIIKTNPELVKTVLKAHVLATEKALKQSDKLPVLSRDAYLQYYKSMKADMNPILKKHTPEFYKKKWSEVEITYDPNFKFIKEDFDFMSKKGVMKGKTINDFVRLDFLNEVLNQMGKQPIK